MIFDPNQAHLNDLAPTQVESEGRVPPVARGVKFGAIEQGAHVVDLHLVPLQRLVVYSKIQTHDRLSHIRTVATKVSLASPGSEPALLICLSMPPS